MDHARRRSFDEIADLYDAARPSYPEALVQAVADVTPAGGRVLEIGSGPGKATVLFARRGYRLVALEPGPHLAAIAARNLEAFPNARVEVVSFEDWPLQAGQFDLVMAASSFHWITPEVRYVKSAQALADRGYLALFWNMTPEQDDPLARDIQGVFDLYGPPHTEGSFNGRIQRRRDEIDASGLFEAARSLQFPWSQWYTTEQYLQYLMTHSDHHILPEANKRSLCDGIAEVLERNGGGLQKEYVAVLFLARKK